MSELALEVWQELEKAVSLVTSARRMVSTGARVDLAALEGKIRHVCKSAGNLPPDESENLLPVMESLIDDLDYLAHSVELYQHDLAERLHALSS